MLVCTESPGTNSLWMPRVKTVDMKNFLQGIGSWGNSGLEDGKSNLQYGHEDWRPTRPRHRHSLVARGCGSPLAWKGLSFVLFKSSMDLAKSQSS